MLSLSQPPWHGSGDGITGERRKLLGLALRGGDPFGGKVTGGVCKVGCRLRRRKTLKAWARVKAVEAPLVESGQRSGSVVEIPVSCYQVEELILLFCVINDKFDITFEI